jgi:hypothetical protein
MKAEMLRFFIHMAQITRLYGNTSHNTARVRTSYLTFNFVRRFVVRHVILNHKMTALASNNLNCYSALPPVSQRTVSSHRSDILKTEYINVGH